MEVTSPIVSVSSIVETPIVDNPIIVGVVVLIAVLWSLVLKND